LGLDLLFRIQFKSRFWYRIQVQMCLRVLTKTRKLMSVWSAGVHDVTLYFCIKTLPIKNDLDSVHSTIYNQTHKGQS